LAALTDDGFRLIGPYGFVLDKQQWLDRDRTGAFHTQSLDWDDVPELVTRAVGSGRPRS